MRKSNIFDEKTVLITPTPVHASSMAADGQKTQHRKSRMSEHSFETISHANTSFGILSMKSMESDQATAADRLRKERALAANAINRCSSNLTSLPSRLLKPSEVSTPSPKDTHLSSDSTISESDLVLPTNSSTPRTSLLPDLSNLEHLMQGRQSTGRMYTNLALSMRTEKEFGQVLDDFIEGRTLDPEFSFCPGEEAISTLERDEASWKRNNDLPASLHEFSLGKTSESQISMGSFFQKKCNNISELQATSPEKDANPVALIESLTSNLSVQSTTSEQQDSFSVSAIAKILSDTKQTPTKVTDYLLQNKKGPKSYKRFNKTDAAIAKPRPPTNKKTDNSTIESSDTSLRNICDTVCTNETDERKELKEAINGASKENINSLNIQEELSPDFNHDKSALSSRSSSSLSSLPNGKLPVATTKTELIWGCVKPGKNISQDFIMKNKSSNRLGVKCSVSNPSFRLLKDGADMNFSSTLKIILHPYESRTLTVTFAPTIVGAAFDHLYFTPLNSNQIQSVKQFIRLFGYGGHGSLVFLNVVKDTAGKFLLSLGYIESQEVIKKKFIIKNNGTLPSFAYIGFVSNGLYLFSNVTVSPQTLVLLPKEEKEILITYTPKKEDRSYMQSKTNTCVIDVGKLTVIYGTEVDRGRLRKLYIKAEEKGLGVDAAFADLIRTFPGEVMPNDLKLLREPVSGLDSVLRLIKKEEVSVTLEQDLDRTLIESFHNDTGVFHSLCENTNVDMFENTVKGDIYHVEPTKVILTPPGKVDDMIFLNNSNMKKIYFEVNCTPEGLHLKPKNGTVLPGETVVINVKYTEKCKGKHGFKVMVLVDNESYEVDVKVVFLTPKSM